MCQNPPNRACICTSNLVIYTVRCDPGRAHLAMLMLEPLVSAVRARRVLELRSRAGAINDRRSARMYIPYSYVEL